MKNIQKIISITQALSKQRSCGNSQVSSELIFI